MTSFLEKLKGERISEMERSGKKEAERIIVRQKRPVSKQTEGQLAVDVYQTDEEIVVIAPIARTRAEDLDVSIEGDTLTIKGMREAPEIEKEATEFLYQECYWGEFSRQIILPEEIDESRISALLRDGFLTLILPKKQVARRRRVIMVKEEETE